MKKSNFLCLLPALAWINMAADTPPSFPVPTGLWEPSPEGAIAAGTESIRLNPKSAAAYYSRGKAELDQGNQAGAMADFKKSISLDSKFAPAYVGRGAAEARSGDWDAAITDYSKAIRLDPKNALAHLNRGLAFASLPTAYVGSASFQKQMVNQDGPEAIRLYTEAIRLDPKNSLNYANRAMARELTGDKSGAAQDREEAAKAQDAAPFAEFLLKARAWRELPAKPPLPEAVRRFRVLADDAYQNKEFEKAAEYYEKGLALDPLWPDGQFNCAIFDGELHHYAQAANHMKRFLELMPDSKDAPAAREKMYIWEEKAKEASPPPVSEPDTSGTLNRRDESAVKW